jgi:hypothetical protein
MTPIEFLRMRAEELSVVLPRQPRSDWQVTNHYEITDDDKGDEEAYFWFTSSNIDLVSSAANPSETDSGRMVGLMMDLFCYTLNESQAGQCSAELHKLGASGATPEPATIRERDKLDDALARFDEPYEEMKGDTT